MRILANTIFIKYDLSQARPRCQYQYRCLYPAYETLRTSLFQTAATLVQIMKCALFFFFFSSREEVYYVRIFLKLRGRYHLEKTKEDGKVKLVESII